MQAREGVRALLKATGLIEVAREVRGAVSGLPWLFENSRVRLHGAADGLPLPPLRLVRASTGTSSLTWLVEGGALAAESIRSILKKNGVDMRSFDAILDFGCGCGRVLRQWTGLPAAVHGSDYNRRSVEWCRRHLAFARCAHNALAPPLPYRRGQFDLVYALSVFTHLPEPLMLDWMRELARVVKPGGYLVISTHGDAYLDQLTPEQQHDFRAGRVVVKDELAAGTNRCGTYVSEQGIRQRLTSEFELLDFVPQGARGNPHQDLSLLRRR
jgi:2-polyprenyl-3-methyl-5-hydroxy-6-metoxy-1,4-benzoquinol methylase